ncbi:MAG: DUF2460 domain-containing protein [Acidobacteria bacterium]|nr:DUF2460 domain-containing protein [Acidobacteriota bacterium]
MADFPKLKTGAVAQYPIARETRLANQTVRFLDGSTQRYRDAGATRRRWQIRLDLLDEGESAAMQEFFAAVQGAYATFTFTDPWDGHAYENCRLTSDAADFTATGEMQGNITLTVTQ